MIAVFFVCFLSHLFFVLIDLLMKLVRSFCRTSCFLDISGKLGCLLTCSSFSCICEKLELQYEGLITYRLNIWGKNFSFVVLCASYCLTSEGKNCLGVPLLVMLRLIWVMWWLPQSGECFFFFLKIGEIIAYLYANEHDL